MQPSMWRARPDHKAPLDCATASNVEILLRVSVLVCENLHEECENCDAQ